MTAEAPTTTESSPTAEGAPPPPPPPPASPAKPKPKPSKPRIAIGVTVLMVVISAYALSLFGVHLLEKSEGPLPPLDISQAGPDETVVQIRLEELKSTTNRLTVNVLI